MDKSLLEQIKTRCLFFNGIGNKACLKDISYESVRDESKRPFGFPCIQTGGQCASAVFPNEQESIDLLREIEELTRFNIKLYTLIKDKFTKDKKRSGTVECPRCKYIVSTYNDHIQASCTDPECDVTFRE